MKRLFRSENAVSKSALSCRALKLDVVECRLYTMGIMIMWTDKESVPTP
jgi:hypothetical protein